MNKILKLFFITFSISIGFSLISCQTNQTPPTKTTYQVIFEDYDGTILKEETVEENKYATAPIDPVREGYTFIGWDKKFSKINSDITITALYEKLKVVTFNSFCDTSITPQLIKKGRCATEPTPPIKEGYTFLGWYLNDVKWVFASFVEEDITLDAKWTLNEYSITYDLGVGTAQNPTTYTVEDTITLNNPTHSDYEFIGWTTEDNEIPSMNVTINKETNDKHFIANYKNVKLQLNENDEYEVAGLIYEQSTTALIPNYYNGKKVTLIKENAFISNYSLQSIKIPENITQIGLCAFWGCTSLTDFFVDSNNEYFQSIDGSLYSKDATILHQYALAKKDTLFKIPEGVVTIGPYAFSYSQYLITLRIPNSVTTIEPYAFAYNISLNKVIFEENSNLTTINENAFVECFNLTNINLQDKLTTIQKYAFWNCSNLLSINIPQNIEYIGIKAFLGCSNLQYNIYNNLKYLGNKSNPYLVLIDVNDYNMTNCTIHKDTKLITPCAFSNKINVSHIDVEENSQYLKSIDGTLYTKDEKTLIKYAPGNKETDFITLSTITTIGEYAFLEAHNLENVIITNNVTTIQDFAFNNCHKLSNIYIPLSVENVGMYIFYLSIGVDIYCEAPSKPIGWDEKWEDGRYTGIHWNYTKENE